MRWLRILSCFMVLGLFYWVWDTQQATITTLIDNIDLNLLLILASLQLIFVGFFAIPFCVLARTLSIPLNLKEAISISFVSNLLNHLLPYRPGFGFRYLYLRKNYNVAFATFSAISTTYMILGMAVGLTLGLIGWSISTHRPALSETHPLVLAGLVLFLIITLIPCIAKLRKAKTPSPFMGATQSLYDNKKPILRALASISFSSLMSANTLYICFEALKTPIPLALCFFIMGMITLISTFQITPGNIGLTESVIGSVTVLTHGDFTMGFTAWALYRGSQFLTTLCIGTPLSLCYLKLIKSRRFSNGNS
jgi:uncharacterized membrane protein YbhN (UPF0104 family)